MTTTRKQAAHFLCWPELAFSPPNRAIVECLLALGFTVDLFAPGEMDVSAYGPNVRALRVDYGRRWIAENLFSRRWAGYSLFSGTTEDPMAVVGLLSALYRKPSFTLADEIKTASFSGNRSPAWKRLCRWGMRRSSFNIVNSREKIPLQREYLGVNEKYPSVLYPGCFHEPPVPGNRDAIRSRLGIPLDATVLCYSGQFGQPWGADWLLEVLQDCPKIHVMGQMLGLDPLTRKLLAGLRGADRLHLEPGRLSWEESWSAMAAVDVGMVVYHHPAPQFQNNGLASNRLCMFLAMGVPVVASRQASFRFLEDFDCGRLAGDEAEFVAAVRTVKSRLPAMKANATRCAREYIDAPARFRELSQAIASLVS